MGKIKAEGVGKEYLDALVLRYESEIKTAVATLRLYTSDRLTAIGEHSDLQDEQDKWLQKYQDSKGKLESIKEIFDREDKING
jgi:hypothetical protein